MAISEDSIILTMEDVMKLAEQNVEFHMSLQIVALQRQLREAHDKIEELESRSSSNKEVDHEG